MGLSVLIELECIQIRDIVIYVEMGVGSCVVVMLVVDAAYCFGSIALEVFRNFNMIVVTPVNEESVFTIGHIEDIIRSETQIVASGTVDIEPLDVLDAAAVEYC